MVGPSKILTVSYGTFSCTLEGFDDPFSTMRGIAEYFRDLAADDRYFGAEPPTPDAEMLHRIAEKEIQRRVESRVSDNGIVLRQTDEPAQVSVERREPRTQPASADDSAETEAAEPVAEIEEPTTPPTPTGETVAEKLARIRAATARQVDVTEPDEGDADIVPGASASLAAAFAVNEDDDEDDDAETAEESVFKAEAEAEDGEPEVDEEPAFEDEPQDEIEAVAEADEVSEDPVSGASPDDEEQVEASDEAEEFFAGADQDESVEDEDASDENEDGSEDFNLDSFMQGMSQTEDDAEEVVEAAEFDASETERQAEDDDDAEEDEEAAPSTDFAALVAAETAAADAEHEDTEDNADDDQDAVSRIVRMRKADFETATDEEAEDQAEDADNYEPLILAAEDAVAVDQDAADASDEADDEVEPEPSELAGDHEDTTETLVAEAHDDEPVDETEADADEAPAAERITGSGASVERLFDVTDNEMKGRESSRRRSAIEHLKAAVAATRAEQAMRAKEGEDAHPDDDMTAYREDLARVVRPRRPVDSDRPTSRRLPPLMLVSEQRVDKVDNDVVDQANAAMIKPRRISKGIMLDQDGDDDGEDNIFSDAGSFAEFAAEVGAEDLPELLEAAAAYYTHVEGQPHFSRPQIMRAVAQMNDAGEFTREESLRSFGLLLRNGRIRKVSRGQFEIVDNTRFRPQLQAGE